MFKNTNFPQMAWGCNGRHGNSWLHTVQCMLERTSSSVSDMAMIFPSVTLLPRESFTKGSKTGPRLQTVEQIGPGAA